MNPNPVDLPDPRRLPNFNPTYLPLCEGGELPVVGTEGRHERVMIAFAAAYYGLNRAQARIEAATRVQDAEAEVAALEEFCAASRVRDDLEDRCHPEGIYAEPVKDGDYYINLWFQGLRTAPRRRLHVQEFRAEFVF